jgi:hypothetical protein
MSAWLYLPARSNNASTVSVLTSGGQQQFHLLGFGTDNLLFTDGRNGANNISYSGIPLQVWFHYAMTLVSNQYAFYVNGVSVASGTFGVAINTGTPTSVQIGRRSSTMTGFLDDIRIYNRALTPAEIRLLASRRGIGLTSIRKRPPCNYPIVQPSNRLWGRANNVWVPGTAEVNKNDYWANYAPQIAYYHAEASAWESRVRANGGTVSPETLQAVSDFCTAIDAAGIRNKLYRVNLFCGDNLRACLVPLYTSPSAGSAPVGGYAVDLNTGFIGSDYLEKGIGTGGLRGNGTAAKKLSTGLRPQDIVANSATGHYGMYIPPFSLPTFRVETPVSSFSGGTRIHFDYRNGSGVIGVKAAWAGNVTGSGIANPSGLIVADRSSSTRFDQYQQGVSVANTTTAIGTIEPMPQYEIFSNQLTNYTSNPLFGYTLGSSLTASEHVAYSAAWNTFQASLSRAVT